MSLVPVRDFASLLVDAGFEDVLSVNVSKLSDQRDFDVLLLATGRSPQHAFAGENCATLFSCWEGLRLACTVLLAAKLPLRALPWSACGSLRVCVFDQLNRHSEAPVA